MARYASVVVDIAHEQLDRSFQYRVPPSLQEKIRVGTPVIVPFGKSNRAIKAYVTALGDVPEWDEGKLKEIEEVPRHLLQVEDQLVALAFWMKEQYGATLIQALRTVMPVKEKVRLREARRYRPAPTAAAALAEAKKRKNCAARARFLEALLREGSLTEEEAKKLPVTPSTIRPLLEQGVVTVERKQGSWTVPEWMGGGAQPPDAASGALPDLLHRPAVTLNEQQKNIVDSLVEAMDHREKKAALIHGVTGSGKTEVYMELIGHTIAQKKQAIVLIPEIALTYQTAMRFFARFGSRAAFVNSRLSAGERYEQFLRAKNGEIDVMIGPRSALFTPFSRLGLIVIDEEHENAYKSETAPRYHARETAMKRAEMAGAMVVLGSATPSMEAYDRACRGEYLLYRLTKRAVFQSHLPQIHVVDLREELAAGNKSIFSRMLQEKMRQCLQRKEQIMLFLNRRGYAGFVSCRQCGQPVCCPHCDVSLTMHSDGMLRCHYCGYAVPTPGRCPACGSPYIAGFGLGTQKVQEMIGRLFPGVPALRMDMDTTSGKEGHQKILSAFAAGKAQILIGTQMIVKGHDFPNVTLVGIVAADLSLYTGNYRASEQTFQLLTQAAGRAGRGEKGGDVVIQTYTPDHYSIQCCARQDYETFYRREMAFRRMLCYPPAGYLMEVLVTSFQEEAAQKAIEQYAAMVLHAGDDAERIGPTDASVSRIKDQYRKLMYVKAQNRQTLIEIKDKIELLYDELHRETCCLQFDFS